jgi:glutamate N-acetyltransferase / amino-acid N-acetyltransferase
LCGAERVTLALNGVTVLRAGAPSGDEPTLDGADCTIDLDLALGDGSAGYLTSDLSFDYVRINAEYRS